jgi:hypothetical protein
MRSWGSRAFALGVVFVLACGSGRAPFTDKSATDPAAGLGGPGSGDLGQAKCSPGGTTCVGNDVHECKGDDAGAGAFVKSCDATGEFCFNGECAASCDAAEAWGSNVGCEFWAVDLDNEYSSLNDAAGMPWGIVVSNFGKTTAKVVVEKNDGPPNGTSAISAVLTEDLLPGSLKELVLPTREVDGSTAADNGPGTMVSSNAFRIRSDVPIVVYQFNTLRHSYSNDASLLIPKNGLGNIYRVLGWPTTNPIAISLPEMPPIAGIPDHSFVTIVGTQANTTVKITLSSPIVGGGGIPAKNKGDVIEQVIGPFDVINLESTGIPGDMTGTVVNASAPVAVFTGGERGIAPLNGGEPGGPPAPPDYNPSNLCCTDHLEEQLLPITSYGKTFVITRSPIRSKDGYVEPDILRFMGVAATTTVKTNLPPPNDTFTLMPGEVRDAWTTTDFVAEATEPLVIGQILVSQGFTNSYNEGGDPSLTIPPPIDQYRRNYLFNVPSSWIKNYVVIAAPEGAKVMIDNVVPTGCVISPAGTIAGQKWESRRCVVGEGAHQMLGDAAFGIVAYGYGSRGSYAFVGGANVRRIYDPPPIPPVK